MFQTRVALPECGVQAGKIVLIMIACTAISNGEDEGILIKFVP